MKKKGILLGILFILILSVYVGTANCQEPTPTPTPPKVLVEQSFIDSATKAFLLVVEQRKTIEAFLNERAKSQTERENALKLIAAFDELIAIKDKSISALEKLNQIYEKVIQMQFEIINQLEKRLMKPKSFFQKFLQTLKEIALIAVGIGIGRGL